MGSFIGIWLPFHNLLFFGGMLNELAGRVGKKILGGHEKYRPGPLVLDQGDQR